MEYEKKLALAKEALDSGSYDKETIEYIFPELRESEDERIRKRIIHALHGDVLDMEETTKAIAWLEKQGENNMGISEATKKELEDNLNNALEKETPESWNEFLDGQGEQKPVHEIEPTPIFRIGDILKRKGKDYTFRVDRIQDGYYHCDRNNGAFFPIEEQDNWELIEQKPAWSEEDEKNLLEISCLIGNYRTGDDEYKLDSWLKSLKDKVQPQPKQEWSEEDERLFQIVIDVLDRENHLGNISHTDLIACVRKLKSLRPQKQNITNKDFEDIIREIKTRIAQCNGFNRKHREEVFNLLDSLRPQSQWKPSDKQMVAINTAINVLGKGTLNGKQLVELQEQLKKLKGE